MRRRRNNKQKQSTHKQYFKANKNPKKNQNLPKNLNQKTYFVKINNKNVRHLQECNKAIALRNDPQCPKSGCLSHFLKLFQFFTYLFYAL